MIGDDNVQQDAALSGSTATPDMTARHEWASMWPLPLISMLGLSGSAMFAFSSGTFMTDMIGEFGWTRVQFSFAFVLQMAAGLILAPAIGAAIDHVGPRRVALAGIPLFALVFAMLGLVGSSIWNWWILCACLAAVQAMIGQTVWITCIVGRFHTSRGLAMSVALAGLGLGTLMWPLLAASFIKLLGWRSAFAAMAAIWAIVVLPLTLAFFAETPRTGAVRRTERHAGTRLQALRSSSFIGLLVAGGLFSAAYFGTAVHFVPILRASGLGVTTAAAAAGLIGLFSIAGRLLTGFLLDRLPTRPITILAFILPAPAAILLALAPGSVSVSLIAAALLGLATGSELDVISYITARRFGLAIFGSIYAILMSIVSLCASVGPVIAGAIFDHSRSYGGFLMLVPALVAVAAAIVAVIPLSSPETSTL